MCFCRWRPEKERNSTLTIQCLTHFVDVYLNFTLRQWTGKVERAHIIFLMTTGGSRGQGIRHRGSYPLPAHWRRPCIHPQTDLSPNSTCCVTSRHDKHDVLCESWRDVSCVLRRACSDSSQMKYIRLLKKITAIITLYRLQTNTVAYRSSSRRACRASRNRLVVLVALVFGIKSNS